jgi:hypothetical protein
MPSTKTANLPADTAPVDPTLVIPAQNAAGTNDYKVVIADLPVSTATQTAIDTVADDAADALAAAIEDTPRFIYATGTSTWPDAADDGRVVFWFQTYPGGSPPAAGGRPGREPFDIVALTPAAD